MPDNNPTQEKEQNFFHTQKFSPEVQDILGRPPKWIIRWGIGVVSTVIGILLIGSGFVKYPDTISCPVSVFTINLPVHLAARSTGKIDTLLIHEASEVRKGDILAILENPANYRDAIRAKSILEDYISHPSYLTDTGYFPLVGETLALGEFQSDYSQFAKALQDYRNFLKNDYYNQKQRVVLVQKDIHEKMRESAKRKYLLSIQQLESQKKLFQTDSLLFIRNAITQIEYENTRTNLLQSIQAKENAEAEILSADLSVAQLEEQYWELAQQKNEQYQQYTIELSSTCGNLRAGIDAWEKNYILRSPIDGKIALTSYWQENQQINTGDILLSVIPCQTLKIMGKAKLPSQGAGKVKAGQKVKIQFDAFPYMEFGMVQAEVGQISTIPVQQDDIQYMIVELLLPDSLSTNYGITLPFSQEMQGNAEIITEELSILDRIIKPIKSSLYR
ncbi:MAG: HlyD family secretion protein [Bacteroides sp.]|nr:HlyD family secretion protein [Ruminococcus flavefaciens]MCM1554296.1 HlyD family secretion protein [Bacteroides sp.]